MKQILKFRTSAFAFVALLGIASAKGATWDPVPDPGGYALAEASTLGTTGYAYFSDPSIFGVERDMSVEWVSGSPSSFSQYSEIYPSSVYPGIATNFIVSRGSGQSAIANYVWDGIDGSPDINYTGLGGLDLAASYSGLSFRVVADYPVANWTFTFYTDETHFSTWTFEKPTTTTVINESFAPLFSEFTSSGLDGGADFSNIGAISLRNTGGPALDTILYDVQMTPIPEPSSLALLALSAVALIARRRK